jgi:hypothetical protein
VVSRRNKLLVEFGLDAPQSTQHFIVSRAAVDRNGDEPIPIDGCDKVYEGMLVFAGRGEVLLLWFCFMYLYRAAV